MKLYLAPIKGITDHIYRDTFAHYFSGVDVSITPFVNSVQGRKIKNSYLKDILPENNQHISTVPQILSKDPDDFLFLADRIFDLGYNEVNWNLGCPTPMVAKKQRGSGLLPFPDRIRSVLEKVCAKYPNKLSVKARLGRQQKSDIQTLLPILNEYPLKKVIIHPRLGVQMYKGTVDLDAFADCIPLCEHNLVYNGDICSVNDFQALQKRFGQEISHWMIGRGLLANPFLCETIKGNSTSISRKKLADFHYELYTRYAEVLAGPSHLLGRMKGFWCYYSKIFSDKKKCLKRVVKARNVEKYQDAVKYNFEEEELSLLQ